DPRDVEVEPRPEIDEVAPGKRGILLETHPGILIVPGEDEVVFEPAPDETRVVVDRGIDEVADDLAGRPLAGSGRRSRSRVVEREKPRHGAVDGGAKLVPGLVHGPAPSLRFIGAVTTSGSWYHAVPHGDESREHAAPGLWCRRAGRGSKSSRGRRAGTPHLEQ